MSKGLQISSARIVYATVLTCLAACIIGQPSLAQAQICGNSTINVADDTVIQGVDLVNSGSFSAGIVLSDDTNVLIEDVVINSNGFGINSTGASQFTVNNSTINSFAENGGGIEAFGDVQFTANNLTINTNGDTGIGIEVEENVQFTLNNVNISTSGDDSDGIFLEDNNIVTIKGGGITTTGLYEIHAATDGTYGPSHKKCHSVPNRT